MMIRASGVAVTVRAVVGVSVVLAACSGSDAAVPETDPVTATTISVTTVDDVFSPGDSVVEEMRPVPTVPRTTVEGDLGGVPGIPPTLVSPPPDRVDPDVPATSAAPPSTDLVGDPQPSPNSTTSPTTQPPDVSVPQSPDACLRLAAFGVGETIAERTGVAADSVVVSNDVCRISSGADVVEVSFISIAEVRSDWYLRDGVEPVGEVGGDAVGLAVFATPDGRSGAGYTIATVGVRSGVVVSVMAPNDARSRAAEVAVFAQQAA